MNFNSLRQGRANGPHRYSPMVCQSVKRTPQIGDPDLNVTTGQSRREKQPECASVQSPVLTTGTRRRYTLRISTFAAFTAGHGKLMQNWSLMTLAEIREEIAELRTTIDAQSDFIGVLISQSAITTAKLDVCIEMLSDILEKHGVNRGDTSKKCGELLARYAAAAQQSISQAIQSADSSRPPSTSGPEAAKN